MNKDALLATAIGFFLGILLFSVIIFGPKITSRFPKIHFPAVSIAFKLPSWKKQETKPETNAQPTNTTGTFAVTAPLPETLAESDSLLVSGTAPAGATVVIGGPTDESIQIIPSEGKFAGEISLVEGKNLITVTAIGSDGIREQTLVVYYTPEKF